MGNDPRAEFIRRSSLLAQGRSIQDAAAEKDDAGDAWSRDRFNRDHGITKQSGTDVRRTVPATAPDEELRLDAKDPRSLFIQCTQFLAEGKRPAQLRDMHRDSLKGETLDHRERFMRDSRRLGEGEVDIVFLQSADWPKEPRAQPKIGRSVFHHDTAGPGSEQRSATVQGIRVKREDHGGFLKLRDDEDDPREALLKKLAALGR
jgi:hypothetical protein